MLYFDNLSKFSKVSHFVETRKEKADTSDYMSVSQVHGDNVLVIKDRDIKDLEGDAMITDKKGIGLAIRVADCVPILFFDPVRSAIGLAHAGWRGTLKKITSKTIKSMKQYFDTTPKNLIVGIGPCICVKHYEVDEAVLPGAKGHFDLRIANRIQLIEAGVKTKNIEIMPYCTYERTDLFYSYRAEGKTGRIMTGIMLIG